MSTYFTMTGQITYQDRADFNNAVRFLQDNKWMDDKGFLHSEAMTHNLTETPNIDPIALVLTIPLFLYRNLGYKDNLNVLFKGGTGKVVWTSTDGCFEGGVVTEDKETHHDLEKWWDEQGDDGEPKPDPDEDIDGYTQWQQEVEEAFFDTYGD